MRPEQVLDCQADLVARLVPGQTLLGVVEGTLRSGQLDHVELTPLQREQNVRRVSRDLQAAARMGLAHRVTADMSLLVQHAASLLDETDVMAPDLAPGPFGIVYFERPLPIREIRGRTMLAHWLVWGKALGTRWETGATAPAVAAWWFNDMHIEPDEVSRAFIDEARTEPGVAQVLRDSGRWGFVGADVFASGMPLGGPLASVDVVTRLRLIEQDGVDAVPFTNVSRYLHALWMLLGQTVTIAEDEHVPRAGWKRAMRNGISPRVTVIRLRQASSGRQDGESLIEWSHRWLVRGHPRWQPYGKRSIGDHEHHLGPVEVTNGHSARYCQHPGCDARVERIWIDGHIKGDPSKPLLIREHVYNLAR